jgi:subtilase family serine protease
MTKSGWCSGIAIRRGLAALGVAVCGVGALDLKAQSRVRVEELWSGHAVVPGPAREGQVRPHVWIRDAFVGPAAAKPAVRFGPDGFWPIDMQTAYGIAAIPKLPALARGLSAGGARITVAIVDAYDSPDALADLNIFSAQYGLPEFPGASRAVCKPTFTKVSESGGATLPARNSGWEVEINLDVQWVHSIAPCANILFVEASSSGGSDLVAAIAYAGANAQVVSMSWGGSEFLGESTYEVYFHTPGVVFLASSGDTGGLVEWPAVSNAVIAVGGTNLPVNAAGGLGTGAETAWSGSGGGCSSEKETEPACAFRGVPDVAAAAGPNSAVAVYISKQGGWFEVYGTSLAAPMWAAMVGIADGLRKTDGKAFLNNSTLAELYAAYSYSYTANYNDITSGTAGNNKAGVGWDFVTGLGSPKANDLVPYLATAP